MSYKIEKRLCLLKKSAKQRNISISLNKDYYSKLLSLGCSYCGKDLEHDNGYSLDRVDNKIGYVENNCLPCCWDCNRAKGKLDFSDFMSLIERIYKHHLKDTERYNTLTEFKLKKAINIVKNSSSYRNSNNLKLKGLK